MQTGEIAASATVVYVVNTIIWRAALDPGGGQKRRPEQLFRPAEPQMDQKWLPPLLGPNIFLTSSFLGEKKCQKGRRQNRRASRKNARSA